MPQATRNHPRSVDLTTKIRFVYEMRLSTQLNQSTSHGQTGCSLRCSAAIRRAPVAPQLDSTPVVFYKTRLEYGDNPTIARVGAHMMPGDGDWLSHRFGYEARLGHRASTQIESLNLTNTTKKFSLGPLGSNRAIPGAWFHSTPEGWVRPQGVGLRVLHHTCLWTNESLTAQRADPYLIKTRARSETE